MKKYSSYSEALTRMAARCSQAEKCEYDVAKKLSDWEVLPDDIVKIIDYLVEHKYLDNERFCGAYIRDKINYARWGRIKIHYHLREKQLPSGMIHRLMNENISEEGYRKTLSDLLLQKNLLLSEVDPYKRKDKLLRFAASRGFEFELTLNILDGIQ